MTSSRPSQDKGSQEPLLTLIIMTRGRQSHIAPLVDYYSHYPIHLIIADGSANPLIELQIPESRTEHFKCSYIHDSSSESYIPRIRKSLELTTTPFVSLVPDDEILLWKGIQEAVDSLNSDSSLASAGGSSSLCRRFGNRLGYADYLNYGSAKSDPWYCASWQNLEIQSPRLLERSMKVIASPFLHKYHYYRLTRIRVIQKFVELMDASHLNLNSGLGELVFALSVHLCGNSKFTFTPFWVRTLKSDYFGGSTFGAYGHQELFALGYQVMTQIEALSDLLADASPSKQINLLLQDHFGHNSPFAYTLLDYHNMAKENPVKTSIKSLVFSQFQSLSLLLTNRHRPYKFVIDSLTSPNLGFPDAFSDLEQSQDLLQATKALRSILGMMRPNPGVLH